MPKLLASLDDWKIRFEPCLLAFCPYNSTSYDPENKSYCCIKARAKNGLENLENGIKKWLDTLSLSHTNGLDIFQWSIHLCACNR